MSRLPYIKADDFDAAQQAMFDDIVSGPRGKSRPRHEFLNAAGGLSGPFHVWCYAPALGSPAEKLGAAVRFGMSLDDRQRELAILVVGARWRAQYEFWAHAPIAAKAGLPDTVIEAIRCGERPVLDDPAEAAIYDFARELVESGRVSDATYAAAAEHLGEKTLVELTACVGYYTMVSMSLNAFEVPIREGEAPPFEAP